MKVGIEKPLTTLFMLMSVDGKINSGSSDELDVDTDWKKIFGVREGLQQYYDIEQTTDLYSFNTGRVLEKIGINDRKERVSKSPVSFVLLDNKPHLKESGIEYLCNWLKKVLIVTNNQNHCALNLKERFDNLEIIMYEQKVDFADLFHKLKVDYGIERLTIQSGGTVNSILIRENLIDRLSIVVAPVIAGGKNTPTLVDGESFTKVEELKGVKVLKLDKAEVLKDSYLRLEYEVVEETKLI